MNLRFQNCNAVVVGGTSGIGYAIAHQLMDGGANVIIAGRNRQRGEDALHKLQGIGENVWYVQCDISHDEDIVALMEFAKQKFNSVDILINSAGILHTCGFEEMTHEDYDKVYDTNLYSIMSTCKVFIPLFKKGGVILNVASNVGLQSHIKGRSNFLYASAKAALIQYSQLLAKNYGPSIRVNCLCPGTTETNIFTNRDFSRFNGCNLMGRVAQPEEIANVATFLVSKEASFMTGSVVVVDGGETLMS